MPTYSDEIFRMAATPETAASGRAHSPSFGAAGTGDKCQVTPETQVAAYEVTGLVLKLPFLVIMPPTPASAYKVGDKFLFDGEVYVVKSPPAIFKGTTAASHGSFIAVKEQFQ